MPDVVDHGDDPFLFIGGNNTDDKVILDTSTEAYGMGGDDKFEVIKPVLSKLMAAREATQFTRPWHTKVPNVL